jgi:hypothetical protein
MNKNIGILLSCCLFFSTVGFANYDLDDVNTVRDQTEDLYKTRGGSQAATYNTVGKSMIAWGFGLAVIVALVSAAVHPSTANSTNN